MTVQVPWTDLVGSIYDAALDDDQWPVVVDRMLELVGAQHGWLVSAPDPCSQPTLAFGSRILDQVWPLYQGYYWQRDVCLAQAMAMGKLERGAIGQGDELVERKALHTTEYFQDFLRPFDLGVLLVGLIFDYRTPEECPLTFLAFHRPPDAEAFSPAEEELYHHLMPHLQRSLRIRWQLVKEREARHLSERTLDCLSQAVVLLDEAGRVLFANHHAEAIFRQGGGPVCVNHRLTAVDAQGASGIREGLRRAALGVGSSVCLRNPVTGRQWAITFSPLRISTPATSNSARIVALIGEPNRPATSGLAHFAALYRLTPAETRILEQLLKQDSLQDIADSQRISIATLRTHLRALYAKTRTSGQRELVRFYLTHPSPGANNSSAA